MKAPLSPLVQKILSDENKAKAFSAAVLNFNRTGKPILVEVEGKKYKFVRVMSQNSK